MGGADDKYRFHLDPIAIERKQTPAWAGLWSWTTDYSKPFPYFIPLADFRRLRAGFLRTEPTLVLCASFFWTRWKLLLSTVCVACLFRRVWWKFGKMKILQLGKIFYPLEGKLIIKKKRLSRERKGEREGSNFFNFFLRFFESSLVFYTLNLWTWIL